MTQVTLLSLGRCCILVIDPPALSNLTHHLPFPHYPGLCALRPEGPNEQCVGRVWGEAAPLGLLWQGMQRPCWPGGASEPRGEEDAIW